MIAGGEGPSRHRVAKPVVAFLVAATLVLLQLPLSTFPDDSDFYHPDEGLWTAVGKYSFQKYFIEHDWSRDSWDVDFTTFGRQNPTVGKFIIGASQFLSGAVDRETTFPAYEPDAPWEELQSERPPPAALEAARRPMRWLFLGSGVLLLLLTIQLTGSPFVGMGAVLLFAASPIVQTSAHRAMMEMPATFFSLLALVTAAQYLARIGSDEETPAWSNAIPIGLSCGFAVSTKLSALLIPVVLAIWIVLASWARLRYSPEIERDAPHGSWAARSSSGIPRYLRRLVDTGLVKAAFLGVGLAALVFFASNPLLYHRPIAGTRGILRLASVVATYDVPDGLRLDTLSRRLSQMVETGLIDSGPIQQWLGLPFADMGLAGLGIAVLIIGSARPRLGQQRRLGHMMLLSWCCVTAVGTLAWVPVGWPRWYMPLEPCWAIVEAIAVTTVARRAWSIFAEKKGLRRENFLRSVVLGGGLLGAHVERRAQRRAGRRRR